jgi:hypothetical protein
LNFAARPPSESGDSHDSSDDSIIGDDIKDSEDIYWDK